MATIKRRRFGRKVDAGSRGGTATHVIKIGFDARKQGATNASPGKLNGFLICHDSIDPRTGRLLVDYDAMSALGSDERMIAEAMQSQLRAANDLLPQTLRFVLLHNAERDDFGWRFPGTLEESFELWNKLGLYCHGDGCRAHRKGDGGIQQEIECIPYGADGVEHPEDFCEFSVNRTCKPHLRLRLCLYQPTDNGPEPLSKQLGWEAVYRLDTSSEYAAMAAQAALLNAAQRLNGWLGGLTGALTFGVARRRTGNADAPVGTVGSIQFSLNEIEIQRREAQMRAERIGLDAPRPSLQIAAPAPAAGQPADVIEHVAPPAQPAEPADPVEVGDADLAALLAAHVEAIRRASAEELVGALVDCIARQACDRDMEFQAAWEAACTYEVKGETYIVPDAEWFSAAPDERKAAARVRILRAICEQLAADPDSGWTLGRGEAEAQS